MNLTAFLNLILVPIVGSFLISYLTTPVVIKLARRLKIIDNPKGKKHAKVIHSKPTPRGGGIPIFLSVLFMLLLILPIDKHILGILLGALVIALMGYFDDRYNLSPYTRLAVGAIAALIPISTGIGINFITNPIGGTINFSNWLVSDIFAVFWIVFLMNILNMGAKGVDGQLSGVVVIASITIAALSLYYSADITQWPVIILATVTAGSYLGFLPWHKYPQKIMPGYGGSTLAGYFLAIASILSTTKVGTLIVVLGVPLIDTGYTIVRRVLSGKSPVWGDTGHLHHRLLGAGLSKKQVAQVYWSVTAILGILALNLNSQFKFYTIVGVTLCLGGLILWLAQRSKLPKA